jgi:glycosyltransferase involved in cell wall biosynthesis
VTRTRWLLMAAHVPGDGVGGGIVRYTVELARALARRDDVDLHLLTTGEAGATLPQLVGGGRAVQAPPVPGAAAALFERTGLGPWLGGRYDVVHGVKHLVPRLVRARTVLTVHDMLALDRARDFGRAKRVLLRGPYLASLRSADRLVCVSSATRERVRHWLPDDGARASVVPLATSPRLREAEPVPVAEVAGRPFAVVVGDPSRRKNLPVALAAFRRVVRSRPDAVLVLVGPPAWGESDYGPHHAELLASGNLVQLTGVGDGTLRWCYEHCSVALSPSLAEGFGLPAAEALDLGAPLVTSQDPALVEVSGDRAPHLPADDVDAWAGAVLAHLDRDVRAGRTSTVDPRTWDDVAEETVRSALT